MFWFLSFWVILTRSVTSSFWVTASNCFARNENLIAKAYRPRDHEKELLVLALTLIASSTKCPDHVVQLVPREFDVLAEPLVVFRGV